MNTKHLKAKILDLAIRGKLVPQDSSEGNAADLLQKIRDEKGVESLPLASAGKPSSATPSAGSIAARNARSKTSSFIFKAEDGNHYEQFADGTLKDIEDEIPFEIPENWCWCRLTEICELKGGKRIPAGLSATKEKTNHIYIRVSDMKNDSISDEDLVYINESIFNKIKQYTISKDDLYLTIAGTIGRVGEVPEKFHNMNLTENALKLTNIGVNKHFLLTFLKTPFVQDYFSSSFHQVAMPKLSMTTTSKTLIPLPPLSEQQRIVSAIEKAFEQIDIIEKNKLNLKTYIKQTKSKVLDLAIHGKLVDQNPQEGNAFDLLEKIRNEKATRHPELDSGSKQKKLKEEKGSSFIITKDCEFGEDKLGKQTKGLRRKHYEKFADGSLKDVEEEIPFEIPENWCWCKGKTILLPMTSRLPSGDEFKYIDIETVDNKLHKVHHLKIIKTENAPSRASRETLVGDTVFSMVRPYLTNIALITEDLADCIASTGFYVCRPNSALDSVYLYYLMISNYVVNGLNQYMKGDNSPSINGDDITEFYYPLPPLSEQKRIVTKIEQIFEQLDVLEKSLGE